MVALVNTDRLAEITTLDKGAHGRFEDGCCIMEAVAYVAGASWSDHPSCACPVISAFLRSWNDALPDGDRTRLLLPLIPRLVGTRATKAVEERRALMAADWLVRTYTPTWLRLAKLDTHADALAALPEITAMAQVPSLRGPIDAARHSAFAVGFLFHEVGRAAVKDAAREAAGFIAYEVGWSIAYVVAEAATEAATKIAAGADLKPIVDELQVSALNLVHRMIEVA